MNKWHRTLGFIIFSIIVIAPSLVWFIRDDFRRREQLRKIRVDYPYVKLNEEFEGRVTNIRPEISRNSLDFAHVTINDSLKRTIYVQTHFSQDSSLDRLMKIGDFIIKELGSTELKVFKEDHSLQNLYKFELNDSLGYPLKQH